MGRDKAFINIVGVPLWRKQLDTLERTGPAKIFIAGPSHAEWIAAGYDIVSDVRDAAGPLAGIVSAMRRTTTALLLVLAVDLPQITVEYLRQLIGASSERVGIVPTRENRFEPLAATYPIEALAIAERHLLVGNYSVQEFAAQCVREELLLKRPISPTESQLFLNANTPADLALAQCETRPVTRYAVARGALEQPDEIAAEAPLEIRVEGHSVAVVMRTPGHDRELAAGFLVTENLVRSPADVFDITQCGASEGEVVKVTLTNPATFDAAKLTRHVFSSSSCGVCSKATIDAVRQSFPAIEDECCVAAGTLLGLPDALRAAQATFNRTGGLHACALFDLQGNLVALREDVGRHSALDKLVGQALLAKQLPLRGHVLLLSGRVSFEMMQKALAAGIPIVVAISAPTTLAIDFACESNQTLVGFLRGEMMNIYACRERIALTPGSAGTSPAVFGASKKTRGA